VPSQRLPRLEANKNPESTMNHALCLQVIEVLQQEVGIAAAKILQKLVALLPPPWHLLK
jgi:hypothetical protein